MQFIKRILNAEEKDSDKSTVITVMIAVFSGLFGTGAVFGFFNFDDFKQKDSGMGSIPANAPGFISTKTRIPLVDLNDEWRFATGDDPSRALPDFDDSSWRNIKVPSQWENRGVKNYDGFAWYRHSFSIDSSVTNQPVFAFLGQIDDVDEVFVNGHRIGGTGAFPPEYDTAWNRWRIYRIPEGVLQIGPDNVIAVRVYDEKMGGGIIRGNIGLFTTDLIQPLVSLDGYWKFKTGDHLDWKEPEFDDSEFESIQVPAAWESEGYQDYNGFAWYRKSFGPVPVNRSEEMVLLLGKIDDTDEVYLNGELIGQTGSPKNGKEKDSKYDSYHRIVREYHFSSSLLRPENQISVRVHDSQGNGGIYSGPVGIMTLESYNQFQEQLENSEKWQLSKTIDWLLGRN